MVVMPEQGSPISVAVNELAGIAGDGYELRVSLLGLEELVLSRLGAEGPTLLEGLRRAWIPARAKVLRLGGSGEGKPFTGRVAGLDGTPAVEGTAPTAGAPAGAGDPFHALLFEDVLVVAREGRDVEPVFPALLSAVEFDEPAYSVRLRQWPGQEIVLSRMAGQTEEFLRALRANRSALAAESAAALAAACPALPAAPRGALAGMWLPGRLLELEAMEAVCRGFDKAFRDGLLPALLRHAEGEYLLRWASGGSTWVGSTRRTAASSGETGDEGSPLWLLSGKKEVWFLEALSSEDRATYCFAGGEEVPALVSRLLCAPQFLREALYSPLSELSGDKADLAVAAQFLGFLAELRKRFRDRVIHQSPENWRTNVDRLSKSGRT